MTNSDSSHIMSLLPEPRRNSYLGAVDLDADRALELYAWNARMAGACLEQLAHLEVLLRTAIDVRMSLVARENEVGIPWFLMPQHVGEEQLEAIEAVRGRLRNEEKETRDQIIAGLTFGFWSGWLGRKHEELWRQVLRHAFPNGDGKRSQVSTLAERIRKFRNRIAHHDSLIRTDIGFEMQSVFELARIIDADFEGWMKSVDRTREVAKQRPRLATDTVIVPAKDAFELYEKTGIYLCQPNRYFQSVEYMAFYYHQAVQDQVPKIKERIDGVVWNAKRAQALSQSDDKRERKMGKRMQTAIDLGWNAGSYQVFVLTRSGEAGHVKLPAPVAHTRRGTGSAYVRKQRYTSIFKLRLAANTDDL